jgi:basic membrane protein A
MIAAASSKTGTIGFIGGMDIPLIHKFEMGYEEGAHFVNPRINIIPNYIGVTESAWTDPVKGKELARTQIDKSVDVLFTAAGNSGLGAFDAVEQYGKDKQGRPYKFVIGVDSNQNWVKPGFVLTSMVKRVDNAVYQTIKDRVNNQPTAGIHVYGLDNDGVSYALDQYNKELLSPDLINKIEDAKAQILSGKIKVTDYMAK